MHYSISGMRVLQVPCQWVTGATPLPVTMNKMKPHTYVILVT